MLIYRISFKEAIDRISFMIDKVKMSKKDGYALIMARQSLKKQMPKKPTLTNNENWYFYKCPNCNNGIIKSNDDGKFPYCHLCGQALDWSDTE